MKNKPPKGNVEQEYLLPEIEISSKVVKGFDAKGKPSYEFYKEKPYNAPNPKAKKTTASNVRKTISNSPSSKEMEVRREEQDWLSRQNQQYTPSNDYDYPDFMKSTGRFPDVYGSKKKLGPMAKLHGGPGNKATGNDKNNTSDQDLSQVASAMPTIKANISRTKYIARELGLNKLTHLKDSINSYDPATKTKKLDKRKADREEKKEINRNTRKTEGTRVGQFVRKKINKIKN